LQVFGIDDKGNINASNSNPITNVKTVVMFRPYTGKTHQLRVAAKAMGIPLLGDPIYKDGGANNEDVATVTTRTMLHASGIHIPEFLDQPEISIWCPPTFFHDDVGTEIIEQTYGNDATERNATRDSLGDSLDTAVEKLMLKNCDIPGILEVS